MKGRVGIKREGKDERKEKTKKEKMRKENTRQERRREKILWAFIGSCHYQYFINFKFFLINSY